LVRTQRREHREASFSDCRLLSGIRDPTFPDAVRFTPAPINS
jgi:hypothetical protein